MYYYSAAILGVISIAILVLTLLIRPKLKRKRFIITYLICAFFLVGMRWRGRDVANLRLHESIVEADVIKVDEREIDFLYELPEIIYFPHMIDAPVYIHNNDIEEEYLLSFYNTETNQEIDTKLLKLKNMNGYPPEGIIKYEGEYYCIVSTKLLYQGALFFLNKEFVIGILIAAF